MSRRGCWSCRVGPTNISRECMPCVLGEGICSWDCGGLTLVIGRPEDSEVEVEHLPHGKLAVIESVWGHIAGGGANDADTAWMDGQIADFLK